VIVLAFRGARSVENWVSKLDTRLVDTSLCANCQVHQGFQNSWDSVSVRITRELTNAAAANSAITTLVVTGHGLGGALATLAATQYRNTPVTGLGLTRLVSARDNGLTVGN
jgi:putative lipase involved disintegration of autophagic bodies